MRRALQTTMLITASVTLVLGIVNAVTGAGQFVDDVAVTVPLDGQLRFSGVWFTLAFFLTVWAVRNLDEAGPVLRIMFTVMALGGLARIYAMVSLGEADPAVVGAAAVEIAVLGFIPWHAAVVKRTATTRPRRNSQALAP